MQYHCYGCCGCCGCGCGGGCGGCGFCVGRVSCSSGIDKGLGGSTGIGGDNCCTSLSSNSK